MFDFRAALRSAGVYAWRERRTPCVAAQGVRPMEPHLKRSTLTIGREKHSRFGMIVDAEHLSRDNKRLARALREAKLRITNACIEDIDYARKREIDRSLVRQLGTGAWIASHANVIITGATGTGESYVACALAQRACRACG